MIMCDSAGGHGKGIRSTASVHDDTPLPVTGARANLEGSL